MFVVELYLPYCLFALSVNLCQYKHLSVSSVHVCLSWLAKMSYYCVFLLQLLFHALNVVSVCFHVPPVSDPAANDLEYRMFHLVRLCDIFKARRYCKVPYWRSFTTSIDNGRSSPNILGRAAPLSHQSCSLYAFYSAFAVLGRWRSNVPRDYIVKNG